MVYNRDEAEAFEKWVQQFIDSGSNVISYVAIRADEKRLGYKSTNDSIAVKFPFVKTILIKKKFQYFRRVRLGLPSYYKWRSRSGCDFVSFNKK